MHSAGPLDALVSDEIKPKADAQRYSDAPKALGAQQMDTRAASASFRPPPGLFANGTAVSAQRAHAHSHHAPYGTGYVPCALGAHKIDSRPAGAPARPPLALFANVTAVSVQQAHAHDHYALYSAAYEPCARAAQNADSGPASTPARLLPACFSNNDAVSAHPARAHDLRLPCGQGAQKMHNRPTGARARRPAALIASDTAVSVQQARTDEDALCGTRIDKRLASAPALFATQGAVSTHPAHDFHLPAGASYVPRAQRAQIIDNRSAGALTGLRPDFIATAESLLKLNAVESTQSVHTHAGRGLRSAGRHDPTPTTAPARPRSSLSDADVADNRVDREPYDADSSSASARPLSELLVPNAVNSFLLDIAPATARARPPAARLASNAVMSARGGMRSAGHIDSTPASGLSRPPAALLAAHAYDKRGSCGVCHELCAGSSCLVESRPARASEYPLPAAVASDGPMPVGADFAIQVDDSHASRTELDAPTSNSFTEFQMDDAVHGVNGRYFIGYRDRACMFPGHHRPGTFRFAAILRADGPLARQHSNHLRLRRISCYKNAQPENVSNVLSRHCGRQRDSFPFLRRVRTSLLRTLGSQAAYLSQCLASRSHFLILPCLALPCATRFPS